MKLSSALTLVAMLLAAPAFAQDSDSDDGLVEARLVGEQSPYVAPVLRPQLVHHDHTTPIVIGASAAVLGGVGLVAGWSVYFARQAYRMRPWYSLSDETVGSWTEMGGFSFWFTASSSALLVTSEYLLLPESRDVPTLAWIAGGVGLGVAAVGLGFAVGGTHCGPQQIKPGADLLLACDSVTSDATFGPMLAFTALPLINVPLVYLFRRLFAGAPESLSVGPRGVSWSGRF